MDKLFLERRLTEGKSVEAIAREVERHPSTVSYWLKKHGLGARGAEKHAGRGALERTELTGLVDAGLTLAQIAEQTDRSISTVRYWLSRFGLKTQGRRGPRPIVPPELVAEARLAGRRELEGDCPTHGRGTFVIEKSGRARCRRCRMERVSEHRRKVKRILVEEAGGRCERCGYDRFPGALHFHHLEAGTKTFALSEKGAARALDSLRKEAQKCTLLCANCHAEVEHGGPELRLRQVDGSGGQATG